MTDDAFHAELARLKELRNAARLSRRRKRMAKQATLVARPMTMGQWLLLPFAILLAVPAWLLDVYFRRRVLRLTRENRRLRQTLREAGRL